MKRTGTPIALAVVFGLVVSACGASYQPTNAQRQTVIETMSDFYDSENRLNTALNENDQELIDSSAEMGVELDPMPVRPTYTYSESSILDDADEVCAEIEEMGMTWWYATDRAFQSDPLGWASEALRMGLTLWDSAYCPVAEETFREYEEYVNGAVFGS